MISVCVIASRHVTWQAVSLSLIVSLVSALAPYGKKRAKLCPSCIVIMLRHENFCVEQVWVWPVMNKAAVCCPRILSLCNRLSPFSNLGYLVVISLAHCYPCWSCCCWVGTFCCFLPVFTAVRSHTCTSNIFRKFTRGAWRRTTALCPFLSCCPNWPLLNVKRWLQLRGPLLPTRIPEESWNIWRDFSSQR